MAAEKWECEFQGTRSYGAYGPREVLIIASNETALLGWDAVSRKTGHLTEEDRERVASESLPRECLEDEVALIRARYERDSARYWHVSVVQDGRLMQKEAMEKIRNLFEQTSMPGGMVQ